MRYLLTFFVAAALFVGISASAQTIPSVSPWFVNTSNQITQRVASTTIKITGLSDGCLGLSSQVLTSTGIACGSGSGGSGTVSTSSSETSGRIPFWTTTAGSPALLSGGSSAFTFDNTLSKLTVTNASTTNLTVGALTGFLKATAGAVSTALINLASDVTGVLPIANGGTATSTAPTIGQILIGNGSGGYNYVASSTLGGGGGTNYFTNSGANTYLSTGTNLGIGTSSPTSLLNISGSDSGTTITAASAAMVDVTNRNTTNNNFSDLSFSTADAGGTTVTTSKIVGVNTVHTAAATSGDLVFLTRSAGTLGERIRILAAGNVGIGLAAPAASLDVAGATSGTEIRMSYNMGASSYHNSFKNNFSGTISNDSLGFYLTQNSVETNPLTFFADGRAVFNYKAIFNADVGINIGSNLPTSVLEVSTSTFTEVPNISMSGASNQSYRSGFISNYGGAFLNQNNVRFYITQGIDNVKRTLFFAQGDGSMAFGTSTAPTNGFAITGISGLNPFSVASSTGTELFSINKTGSALFNGQAGTSGSVLQSLGPTVPPQWVATSSLGISGGSGTVTSVALTTPTGLSISGSPITTSGTLALSLTSGYVIPFTASTTDWQTAFTNRIASLNGLTGLTQTFATSTTGTDFNIVSSGTTHTFNLPTASASNRGALSSADWTTFNNKFTLPALTNGSVLFSNGSTISQNNANFFWDNTNNKLGLGSTTPTGILSINATSTTANYFEIASSTTSVFKISASATPKLAVGTTTPPWTLSVTGTAGFDGLTGSASLQTGILCLSASKEVINESVACVASAKRYKENIQDLVPGLDELMKLRPVSFTWKKDYLGKNANDPNQNGVQYSLIADEVQKIDPHLVSLTTSETTFEGKKYPSGSVNGLADMNHWVALLVKSIQEIANKNDTQDQEITELKAQIASLQAGTATQNKVTMCSL